MNKKNKEELQNKDFEYTHNLIKRIGVIRFTLYKTWKNALSELGYEVNDITYTTYQNWLKNQGLSEQELEKNFPKSDVILFDLVKGQGG